jgi:hypothetical protein
MARLEFSLVHPERGTPTGKNRAVNHPSQSSDGDQRVGQNEDDVDSPAFTESEEWAVSELVVVTV